MKRRFFILPALCLSLIFGCDSDRRTAQGDGYEEGRGINDAEIAEGDYGVETDRTSAEGTREESQEFVSEAASSSLMEVELAKLVQEKGQSQKVKDFAQKMASDHEQANQKLKALAQKKNITVPQAMKEDHSEKMEDLREKSGSDFDKEYMALMVDQHEKDIDKFESKREDVQDQELQSWIDNTLVSLRKHHEEAKQIKDQLD